MKDPHGLPSPILVVSTNCNAGVKEVLCLDQVPTEGALWHSRCPDIVEFAGQMPTILAAARTRHWFDPTSLLAADARSEYREEFHLWRRGFSPAYLPAQPLGESCAACHDARA